jgi:hypothetical protein
MKVGVALNMLYEHGKHDAAVVHEHLSEGDLVEPLGFNSLWALEHHFNGEFFQIPKMSIRISAPSTIPRRSRPRGKPLRMSACPGCTSARARGRRSTASTEWSSKQQQQTSSVIASVTDVRSGDAPADPTDFPRLPTPWEASDADGTRILGNSSQFPATPLPGIRGTADTARQISAEIFSAVLR